MKRIASYLIALATMAFTFTSCEDVPSPFGEIVKPSGEEKVVIEPTGSGTEKDPYNVAAVLEYVSGLVASEDSPIDVYVQGIVTNVTEAYGTQYGNATFDISDDENGSNKFTFYRGLYFDNQKYSNTSDPGVAVGDKVVICGRVTNYKGNTPETSQGKAWLVSINGKGGSGGGGGGDTPTPGEAKGSGTQADPYNAAGANNFIKTLAADKESDKDIYIKGKLVKYADKGEFSKDFGNASFYLSDDGKESSEQFYVFRTLYLGNVKYTSGDTPKVGDEIIICGKVVNYKGNTPETAANKSYIYSWNGKTEGGGGGDTPSPGSPQGTGTQNDPFNVAAAIAKCQETGQTATAEEYYVKGIVNADCTIADDNYKNATFDMVDVADAAEKFKAFRVLAPNGQKLKAGYKIPKGATVIVCGKLVNYKGNTPETVQTTDPAYNGTLVSVNGQAPEVDGGGESGGGGSAGATTLDVNFKTNGQGDWTIANINLPDGLDYVWTYDNRYGMKASAYVNSKRYVTDCWLVSPTLNLANNATMTFKQALNYATSEYVKVMYTTTNGTGDVKSSEWKEASVDKWPAGSDWNFIESKATLPAGTVRVAFRYTSTADKAATWEIESLSIK